MEPELKGKVIFSDNYQSTFEKLNSLKTVNPVSANITRQKLESTYNGSRIEILDKPNFHEQVTLDSLRKVNIDNLVAYDESILEINAIEGKLRCTAHCSIIQNEKEYVPAGFITLKFYTASNLLKASSTEISDIILTDNISNSILHEYVTERRFFMEKAIPSNSIIFIDGSMFSGAYTAQNFVMIDHLIHINTPPVFFVKNSDSRIIVENFDFASGYNTDLHWANSTLKNWSITPFFKYTSDDGRSKVMFFLKVHPNRSPVRVELPFKAVQKECYPKELINIILYQYLASGLTTNSQARIIQIAEIYAREILKSTNIYKEIERMSFTKTMNEERGF